MNSPYTTSDGTKIEVVRGDLHEIMGKLFKHMKDAQPHVANDTQKSMLGNYSKHFETGDMDLHKDSQRNWIKDIGPIVETCIGHIETYVDPLGVRGEFEGFVSIVDKETTKKLNNLVDHAEEIIKKLPWPKEFEKEKFLKPDFTNLDV
jgi:dipeptidyl-peptidase-3